ncbi:SIS domain-containing protein [uncultured Bosea sp.]|uniref:SIS domain-containing protein n=1 Tax=uncultured Bosea sp. TaxID=211457 RepID=UPI0025FBCD6F|nr:SIS domain-containing protein [uncultured Bosea sp.]
MSQSDRTLSRMSREVAEIPQAAARLLDEQRKAIAQVAAALDMGRISHAVVSGRGSSGHAGTHLRYLIETRLGLSAAPAAPSVVTRYGANPRLGEALYILISQSGRSPDLVAAAEQATAAGAQTIAIVNDANSPAALACRHVIPIAAGPELAVAATKTVVNTMLAGLLLVAALAEDEALATATQTAPQRLAQALALDWSPWAQRLSPAPAGFVIGRGLSLGPAREAALKAAEVLGVPVLAYSAAEVLHGPKAAIRSAHPILGLNAGGEVSDSIEDALATLGRQGSPVFSGTGAQPSLLGLGPGETALDAIAQLVPVYRALEAEATRLGRNVDSPPGLLKVTETL